MRLLAESFRIIIRKLPLASALEVQSRCPLSIPLILFIDVKNASGLRYSQLRPPPNCDESVTIQRFIAGSL